MGPFPRLGWRAFLFLVPMALVAYIGIVAVVLGSGAADTATEPSVATSEVVPAQPVVQAPLAFTAEVAPSEQLAPNETLVATAKDSVTLLETFDGPEGDPLYFDFGVPNPTYFGNRLTMMVVQGQPGDDWVKVALPVRPNGSEAWVSVDDVTLSTHTMRAQVDLTTRAITVWEGGEVVLESAAVIGTDATPTPLGTFYVTEKVAQNPNGPLGPWAIGLSAFSEAMETFDGKLPVIAVHGTDRPDLVGGAHSNGCVRVPNEIIERLAVLAPVGTPVDIVAS